MSAAAAMPSAMPSAVARPSSGETFQERSKGKDVRISNIVAAKAVAAAIRTSLGPRGMDKLLQLPSGEVLISNDGATLLSKLHVLHPAAKMLVECSQSQDVEAGDGTTSVVVLAGALLDACLDLLTKGIHPSAIAGSFYRAGEECVRILRGRVGKAVKLSERESLVGAVKTCLSSKVVSQNEDVLAPIAVDSVLTVLGRDVDEIEKATNVDLRDIRMVEQLGGTVDDTELVQGLVFDKGATKTAGGPSQIDNAKIALIQFCLSAPKTDMDNNVVVSDYAAMDRILRDERKYILNLCKKNQKIRSQRPAHPKIHTPRRLQRTIPPLPRKNEHPRRYRRGTHRRRIRVPHPRMHTRPPRRLSHTRKTRHRRPRRGRRPSRIGTQGRQIHRSRQSRQNFHGPSSRIEPTRPRRGKSIHSRCSVRRTLLGQRTIRSRRRRSGGDGGLPPTSRIGTRNDRDGFSLF
mmetsp:Transcript_15081/g.31654  ORF Transcript_15081/g.31654 Transcript_15081/m.31654 type:complete len:461 (+) Transcript_15081:201-1583(+)